MPALALLEPEWLPLSHPSILGKWSDATIAILSSSKPPIIFVVGAAHHWMRTNLSQSSCPRCRWYKRKKAAAPRSRWRKPSEACVSALASASANSAYRMGVPRTYVSKIENEKATPTLSSLARLASALEVTVPDLLHECGPSREDEIAELLTDPFVAELVEFTSKLNTMQLSSVLAQVRDMVTHPRRGA